MHAYEKYLNTSERQGVNIFAEKVKQLLGLSLLVPVSLAQRCGVILTPSQI